MDKINARKTLEELNFDFTNFTIARFLHAIGEKKCREMIAIPWKMPPTMFGAWISDGDGPREYIFYRNDVLEAHQVHIQLHELSHFLLGHPTLKITRELIAEIVSGKTPLLFAGLPQLRSPRDDSVEIEAETLTNLIQQQIIRSSSIDKLIRYTLPEENFANFLKGISLR